MRELQELRRQAASSIVVPQGGLPPAAAWAAPAAAERFSCPSRVRNRGTNKPGVPGKMRLLCALAFATAMGAAGAQVTIQEYPLPSRVGAHDVWADPAPGGPVWFSGQRSGELGRLDPQTGKVDMVPLGARSSPHGVILDGEGNPWLTDGGQNAIVRVDAKTRAVKAGRCPKAPATRISIRRSSTRPASTGLPAKAGSMGGSTEDRGLEGLRVAGGRGPTAST